MILYYLRSIDPNDESKQVIMESDTLAPMVSCIEHFWNNFECKIPYFRFVENKKDGVFIDFGHYFRFYLVTGFKGSFYEFAEEWEASRKMK